MNLANFQSLERSRGVTTFLTSTCNRNYKECIRVATMDYCGHLLKQCFETKEFYLPQPVSRIDQADPTLLAFSEEENDLNLVRCQKRQFYDQKVCRHLCSKAVTLELRRTDHISPCESMCFQLTRSPDGAGEICPLQKYCPMGCPCPLYKCEKLESSQKLIPVFDLEQTFAADSKAFTEEIEKSGGNIQLITGRWTKVKNREDHWGVDERLFSKILLSDFNGNERQTNVSDRFFPYVRFR